MALNINAAQLGSFVSTPAPGCDAISAQNSSLWVAPPLEDALACNDLPRKFTLTASAVATATSTSVTVFISGTTPTMATPRMVIQKGLTVFFADTVKVTFAEDVVLTAIAAPGTAVAAVVDGAIALNDTADTFGMFEATGATDLTTNYNAQSQDTSKLSTGIQGSSITTRLNIQNTLNYIVGDSGDKAYHNVIRPNSISLRRFFAFLASSDGTRQFGNVIAMPQSEPRQTGGIITATFNLDWQAPYYPVGIRQTLTTAQQGYIDTMEKLVGMFGTRLAA